MLHFDSDSAGRCRGKGPPIRCTTQSFQLQISPRVPEPFLAILIFDFEPNPTRKTRAKPGAPNQFARRPSSAAFQLPPASPPERFQIHCRQPCTRIPIARQFVRNQCLPLQWASLSSLPLLNAFLVRNLRFLLFINPDHPHPTCPPHQSSDPRTVHAIRHPARRLIASPPNSRLFVLPCLCGRVRGSAYRLR
jgi:hypothetical protein